MRAKGSRRFACLVVLLVPVAFLLSGTALAAAAGPPEMPEALSPTALTGTSATLRGVLNPNKAGEAGGYVFRYRASAAECEGPGEQEVPSPFGEAAGAQAEQVQAPVTGLLPATTYTYCVIAFNDAFEFAPVSLPFTFTTPATEPTVEHQEALDVGPTTAVVVAQIGAGGLSGSFQVESVSDAQFEAGGWSEATLTPRSPAQLPAAHAVSGAREELTGLAPDTGYRFRFRATNSLGSRVGEPERFETPDASTASSLPDGRVYELVSGLASPGNAYVTASGRFGRPAEDTTTEFPFRAAESGDALAYVGAPSGTTGSGISGENLGNEFLSVRDPTTGWAPRNITPQVAAGNQEEHGTAYELLSSDLSLAAFSAGVAPAFAASTTPEGPRECQGLYARGEDGAFHALFTVAFAETPSPLACGAVRATAGGFKEQSLLIAGASADHSQLLFQTPAAILPAAEQFPEGEGNNLYDSLGGHLTLVNTLSDGSHPEAAFGAPSGDPEVPGDLGNVISADGSKVFWTDLANGRIYMRENPSAPASPVAEGHCTVAAEACTLPVSEGAAKYWTATPDGRYVFYTEGGELWRYDSATGTPQVLVSEGLSAENPGVQGVIGASEDGSYVYFLAEASLSRDPNSRGESSSTRACEEAGGEEQLGHLPAGKGCNLYALHVGQEPTYVAALAAKDDRLSRQGSQRLGDWLPNLGERTAEVSADGRHLVFESTIELTGYDNTLLDQEQPEGQRGLEVFVYSATAAGPGELDCASCDPRGTPPQPEPVGAQAGLGTYLPASLNPTYMPRWISENGNRVFFDSTQSLLAQDTNNGAQDVYEWEREGEGSCAPKASPRPNGGCVLLISGGESAAYSYFLDADASGANVFFTHRGQIGAIPAPPQLNNVFDARVAGGFPSITSGCTSECPASLSPAPALPGPATVGLQSSGNIPPQPPPSAKPHHSETRAQKLAKALRKCRKLHNRRTRRSCDARAERRYGPPKHKATTRRRQAARR